jgi:autotransporter-associated beta strand protein
VAQPTPLPAGPIELSGTLEVIQVCYPAQNQSERWYEVLEDKSGQRHRLRFDVPPAQTHLTGERVRVRGYRQDGLIHVLAAPPQNDQGLEVLAAASPQTKGLTPTPTPMSLYGGGTTTNTVVHRALVELLIYSDYAANYYTAADIVSYSNKFFAVTGSSINTAYLEDSYGAVGFAGDVVICSIATASGTYDTGAWMNQGDAAATAQGYNVGSYAHKVYITSGAGGWAGLAAVGGNWSMDSYTDGGTICHELGHNLGFNHASTQWNNTSAWDEYGDSSDFMGGAYDWRHNNGPHKVQRGWISPQTLTAAGAYQIGRIEDVPSTIPYPQVLKINASSPPNAWPYFLSFKQPVGFDVNNGYNAGVSLHRWGGGNTAFVAALSDGATFTDSAAGFSLKQVGHDSNSVVVLLSTYPYGPTPSDGEHNVGFQPGLSWSAIQASPQFDLFLGTNYAGVLNATTNSPEYRGRLLSSAFTPPSALLTNTTYYWRVDQWVAGTNTGTGVVWSFVTAPDALHADLALHLTCDARDTVAGSTYDIAGPPFQDGALAPATNPPPVIAGKIGGAFDFDGVSQSVSVPYSPGLNRGTFTLAFWARVDGGSSSYRSPLNSRHNSAGQYNGYNFYAMPDDTWNFWTGNGAGGWNSISCGSVVQGAWIHLVGMVEGATMRVYTNGALAGAKTVTYVPNSDQPLRLGIGDGGSSTPFPGAVDDLMVWGRALSAAEVSWVYSNALAGNSIDGSSSPAPGTFTWTGESDAYWNNPANWAANAVPGSGDTVLFDASASANLGSQLGQDLSVAGINVRGPLRSAGIGGTNLLTLGAGGIQVSNSFVSFAVDAPLALSGAGTFNVCASAALTLSQNVSGNGGLLKGGDGTMTLSGAGSYTGGTTVNGGTLNLSYNNGGSGTIGGALKVNPGATAVTTVANALGWSGANWVTNITLNGGTLSTAVSGQDQGWGMTINMMGGTLGSSVTGGYFSMGAGPVFNVTATNIASVVSADLRVRDNIVFNVARGSSAVDLDITGSLINQVAGNGIVKNGGGVMALEGANSYTGPTAVNAGTLAVNGSLASGSAVTVNNSGTLAGAGTIGGTVTVQSGGRLAAGSAAAIGALAVNNSVVFSSGATALMRISKTGGVLTNDVLRGFTTLGFGGTLVVSNATADATPLAYGDRFVLFPKGAGSYAGSFVASNLPALSGALVWDMSQLGVDGSLAVSSTNVVARPVFSPAPGGYVGSLAVTISDGTAGSTIYFSTNGLPPTTNSAVYAGPILVPANALVTFQAYAVKAGSADSPMASATYGTVTTPTWTALAGGSWTNPSNWLNGVLAGGSGGTADFSQLTLVSNLAVTLDGAQTIGNLVFGDGGNHYTWTLNTGSAGPLTLAGGTSVFTVSNQTATLGAVLAGTNNLVKAGAGKLVINAASIGTGSTTISNGTLTVGPAGRLYGGGYLGTPNMVVVAPGAVAEFNAWGYNLLGAWGQIDDNQACRSVNGGTLKYVGAGYAATANNRGSWTVGALGATLDSEATGGGSWGWGVRTSGAFNSGWDDLNLQGSVTLTGAGNGDMQKALYGNGGLVKSGAGTWVIGYSQSNAGTHDSTYAGDTVINGGTLQVRATGLGAAIPSGSGKGNVVVNSPGILDLNTRSVTINGLSGNGTVGTSAAGAASFTVGANDQTSSYSGVIQDGAGAVVLTKTGAGTLTLGGTNTYTGITTVSNGALIVNGSLAPGSAVTVLAGAALGGMGTVSGPVTLNGSLSPGSGVGTLSMGAATWNGGASYLCEVNGTNGSACDLVNMSGALTSAATPGNPFTIRLASLTSSNTAGPVSGFDPSRSYAWTVATAGGGMNGFNPASFIVNTSAFSNAFTGSFGVTNVGNALLLSYAAPLNPPLLAPVGRLPDGAFQLSIRGAVGQPFSVRGTNLITVPFSSWPVLTNGTVGPSGAVIFSDPSAAADKQRFYGVTSP